MLLGNGRCERTPSDEISEVLEDVQRGRRHALGAYRGNDMKSLMDNLDFQVFSSHHRVAVEMEHSLLSSVDDNPFVLHGLDTAVLVEGTVEQLKGQGRYIQHRERF
mgnify:CR=1 FL=1